MTLIMDGRPQTIRVNGLVAKDSRLLVIYNNRTIWLTGRCYDLLAKLITSDKPLGYGALGMSPYDRVDEVMYQLRKQLKAQGGPEIESRKDGHHAEFRVKV